MPLEIKKGNIFDEDVDILVNATNPNGVMGRGIALAFKRKYPRMFQQYKNDCIDGLCKVGSFNLYDDVDDDFNRAIMCFHTMTLQEGYSKLEYIETGLKKVVEWIEKTSESIAFPALGCGVGGLNFEDVKALFMKYMNDLPNYVVLYEPQ